MSKGGKGGGSQTVTNKLDPAAEKFRNTYVYGKAKEVAGTPYSGYTGPGVAPVNPYTLAQMGMLGPNGALGSAYGQASAGLGQGMEALQRGMGMDFGSADLTPYMNPYQQQVMQQMNQQFGDLRQQTMNDLNQQATSAGAFGGSRHGVATGQALADLGKTQAQQQAALLQSGYSDAANRWAADRANLMAGGDTLANLGFAGLQGQQGLLDARLRMGDYLRQIQQAGYDYNRGQFTEKRDWDQRQLNALLSAMGSPVGSATTTPYSSNPMGGALGGAMAGSAFGLPGALVGGGIGLLGSFF